MIKKLKLLILLFFSLLIFLLLSSCDENKNKLAKIDTNKGTFVFVLFEDKAPITAKNFIDLAKAGFYDRLTFHRYVPGFVIQGGDPRGDGTGGSEKNINLEIHPDLRHSEAGIVAMARSQDPNSASSQFYVTLAPTPNLDGSYAVFGKVVHGLDIVKNLRVGDRMLKVTIIDPSKISPESVQKVP